MPRRSQRPCVHPGCRTLTDDGRCPAHERVRQQRADTKTGEERTFYGSGRWKRIRLAQLRREPLCRLCLEEGVIKPARVADHIIPRREGGTEDESNIQSLCWTHHQRKRQQERGQRANSSTAEV